MTFERRLRAGFLGASLALLTGCASLPFGLSPSGNSAAGAAGAASAPAAAASAAPNRVDYRLDVRAPGPLRALLLDYLDLSRFQSAPATDGVDATELERLLRAAPAQARGLLETEGYFNAVVTATRAGTEEGVPLLRVEVDPGPRTTVHAFSVDTTGALRRAAEAGDAAALRETEALRSQWPLRVGDAFRQSAWASAKNTTLARLRADGYAAALWSSTEARIDAPQNRADLAVVLDSGPLFRLGEIRIEGAQRYDERAVLRLSTFAPGDAYSEKSLLDFQERLQKVGLYEGASVEIDADPRTAEATPVRVRVKEQAQHTATFGAGFSANTGPRVSVEHTNRRVFGWRAIARNKLEVGPENKLWEGELSTYPLEGLYRNLLAGSASRLTVDDQKLVGWNVRIGRTQDTPRIERLYFAEFTDARVEADAFTSDANAVSANYHWIYRDLDDTLLPTRGLTVSAQAGLGVARGSFAVVGQPIERDKGPFARLYSRLTWYQPLGGDWYGTARLEAGQVLTRSVAGIPDTLLFRAGGDDSVRGYGYRTLGREIVGNTFGGRTLLTGSLEVARPISPRFPAVWGAAFIDAGNAADRWSDYSPALGYGVGLRLRSPVGPLKVDVAYGQEVKRVRLHLSVGITF